MQFNKLPLLIFFLLNSYYLTLILISESKRILPKDNHVLFEIFYDKDVILEYYYYPFSLILILTLFLRVKDSLLKRFVGVIWLILCVLSKLTWLTVLVYPLFINFNREDDVENKSAISTSKLITLTLVLSSFLYICQELFSWKLFTIHKIANDYTIYLYLLSSNFIFITFYLAIIILIILGTHYLYVAHIYQFLLIFHCESQSKCPLSLWQWQEVQKLL